MAELRDAQDFLARTRPTFVERAASVCAPAALAAGFGTLGGPEIGAVAGAIGAGVGLVVAGLTERFAERVRRAAVENEQLLRARSREETKAQLEDLVAEAARTAAEFERRAAFAEDARRSQNQLLAELAPEFYGLLRSMGHHADQLVAADLMPEEHESANALAATAGSMRRLLGAVLDLARARAGRLRLRERDFDLLAALERTSTGFEQAARRKGVEFQLAVGRLSRHWRFGDERRVQQMLERMLGAALDTTERGAIELVVSEDPDDASKVRFELRDAAPIHDQASFDRLLTDSPSGFESLFELDASLSLALAKGLAEVLGGELRADARKEGGHTVVVVVPLAAGTDPLADDSGVEAHGVGLRAIVAAPPGPLGDLAASTAASMGWIVERCTDAANAESAIAEWNGVDVLVVSSSFDAGRGLERTAEWTGRHRGAAALVLLDPSGVRDPRAVAHSGATSAVAGSPHPSRLREALAGLVRPVERAKAPVRALLASDDDAVASAETARLHAQGLVVDRVNTADELVEAFQDAVYGLVVVDQGSIDESVRVLTERLRTIDGLSTSSFKFHVLAGRNSRRAAPVVDGRDAEPRRSEPASSRPAPRDAAPDMPSSPSENPIDHSVLEEIRSLAGDGGTDLLAELIGMFLEETPVRLRGIHEAIDRDDLVEVERIAHALKSSSGNLGALLLASMCREIEASCREGQVDDVKSLVERSRTEFERVRAALSAELG
ncbi:MAG: Hpt domain-containing protein [Planctomycetota bacterium]